MLASTSCRTHAHISHQRSNVIQWGKFWYQFRAQYTTSKSLRVSHAACWGQSLSTVPRWSCWAPVMPWAYLSKATLKVRSEYVVSLCQSLAASCMFYEGLDPQHEIHRQIKLAGESLSVTLHYPTGQFELQSVVVVSLDGWYITDRRGTLTAPMTLDASCMNRPNRCMMQHAISVVVLRKKRNSFDLIARVSSSIASYEYISKVVDLARINIYAGANTSLRIFLAVYSIPCSSKIYPQLTFAWQADKYYSSIISLH